MQSKTNVACPENDDGNGLAKFLGSSSTLGSNDDATSRNEQMRQLKLRNVALHGKPQTLQDEVQAEKAKVESLAQNLQSHDEEILKLRKDLEAADARATDAKER